MPAMRTTTHTTSPFLGHQRQPSMSVLGGCGDDLFCKTSTPQPTRPPPERVPLPRGPRPPPLPTTPRRSPLPLRPPGPLALTPARPFSALSASPACQCWVAAVTASSAKLPRPSLPDGTLRGYPYSEGFGMTCQLAISYV